MPFATWPDRSDVPRSAARPLRYMDRYVTVTQGEVFYTTELLARLEGIERGPAGNTSLAAAISLAQELPADAVIVVQETEYTGAGKHGSSQLSFARENGVSVSLGDPRKEIPGESIVLPAHPSLLKTREADLGHMRRSLIRHAADTIDHAPTDADVRFLADETKTDDAFVRRALNEHETDFLSIQK
jgi:threonine synthase